MSYVKLKKMVEDKELEILLMLSTPRTRSTALQKTMTQSAHGQINAPCSNDPYETFFLPHDIKESDNVKLRTFDSACQKIIKVAEELKKKSPQSKKVSLVVNEYFLRILDDEMGKLVALTENIVIPIRNSNAQIASLIVQLFLKDLGKVEKLNSEQVLNGLSMLSRGSKNINPVDLAYLKTMIDPIKVRSILGKKEDTVESESDLFDAYKIFIKNCEQALNIIWDNFKYYVDQIIAENHESKNAKHIAIIDTDVLLKNQEDMMKKLLARLSNIELSDKMFAWEISLGEDYRTGHNKISQVNAWSIPAKESKQLTDEHDSVNKDHIITDFPETIRPIAEKAQVLYEKCLQRPEYISLKAQKTEEPLKVSSTEVDGEVLIKNGMFRITSVNLDSEEVAVQQKINYGNG